MTPGCSDPVRVAIASLVKLINLLGAEMLVGKHRDDVDAFEQSVRAKLYANVQGVSPGGYRGGRRAGAYADRAGSGQSARAREAGAEPHRRRRSRTPTGSNRRLN